MRYNDREIAKVAEGPSTLKGILHHMKPQGKDWSDWYQQPSFKERYFKLISNFLFYYRVNEKEPIGLLVLENSQITYERPHRGIPFAFSITFKDGDKVDGEAKHILSCRCQEDVNKWVYALRHSSYEYWRSQCIILNTKISMKTGKDPVLDYMRNKNTVCMSNCSVKKNKEVKEKTFIKHSKKSTFYSQIETSSSFRSFTETNIPNPVSNGNTGNLIDL